MIKTQPGMIGRINPTIPIRIRATPPKISMIFRNFFVSQWYQAESRIRPVTELGDFYLPSIQTLKAPVRFSEKVAVHNVVMNHLNLETEAKAALAWTTQREQILAVRIGFGSHGVDKCKQDLLLYSTKQP